MLKTQHNLYTLSYAESVQVIDVKLKSWSIVFISVARALEMVTKKRIGKLDPISDVTKRFSELVKADKLIHYPITHVHSCA